MTLITTWLVAEAIILIEQAAIDLRLPVTSHARMIERVTASVRKLSGCIDHANGHGELQQFNRAYQTYRLAARERGRRFMSYGAARTRLECALQVKLATRFFGIGQDRNLIDLVFGTGV